MTDTVTPAPATPPAAAPKRRARFKLPKGLMPTKIEALTFAVGALVISNAYLFAEQRKEEKPLVVTVGVRQLTAEYMLNVGNAQMKPEELQARTELFLAVAQDSMKRMATEKGVVVIAREAVLGGEYADVTAEVGQAVNAALTKAAGPSIAPAPGLGFPQVAGAPAANAISPQAYAPTPTALAGPPAGLRMPVPGG